MSLWRMILTAVNLVGVRFGGAAIGLVSQVLMARLLPQQDVGIIFMTVSAAAIISLLMTGGYPPLTMTVLPRYYALGRKCLSQAFHSAVWRDSLVISIAILALATMVYLWAPVSNGLRTALLFGALMSPASSLIRITSSVANSRRRFTLSYVPDFLFRPGLLLLFLAAVWVFGIAPHVETVLWVIVAITTAVALGQAVILGGDAMPHSLRRGRHDLAPSLRGRAFSLVIVAAVAASFADIVTLIGGLFLAPNEVAQLGVAVRLAALAGFVTQATQNFVLPDLSAAITQGERRHAETLLFRINLIALTAIGGCLVGALLFGPLFLGIFGKEYASAHWPLVLFMLSQVFRAAGGMNQHLLSLDGYQARSAGSCVLATTVLIAVSVVLTPTFGVLGMAIAVLLSEIVWATALGLQAQHYAGYRGDIFAVLRFHRQPAE